MRTNTPTQLHIGGFTNGSIGNGGFGNGSFGNGSFKGRTLSPVSCRIRSTVNVDESAGRIFATSESELCCLQNVATFLSNIAWFQQPKTISDSAGKEESACEGLYPISRSGPIAVQMLVPGAPHVSAGIVLLIRAGCVPRYQHGSTCMVMEIGVGVDLLVQMYHALGLAAVWRCA